MARVEKQRIALPFTPRPWQARLIDDPAPRIVAVVHRRAGKSTALLWRGFKVTITSKRQLPRVVHVLPYAVMWARTGLWDQAVRATEALPGAQVRRSEMAIRLPTGGTWQAGGADNPDSWRGGYADECIIDEFDDTPQTMVPLVIEPMLADRAGTLVRSGTPKRPRAAPDGLRPGARHRRLFSIPARLRPDQCALARGDRAAAH